MKLSVFFLFSIVLFGHAQTCEFLDKNQVKAIICVSNDKFWDINGNQEPVYEVPKGSLRHSQFANSIWIGGLDPANQLHLSANTYKQLGTDFWPGPLDTSNIQAFNSNNSQPYQRVWKIGCDDISNFVQAFNTGSVTAGTYTVPNSILDYPAKGALNFQKKLSPYYDANNNGVYNPKVEGDHPVIRGHQQILSIYNDQQNTHTETGMPPLGLEIHEYSYVFSEPQIHDSMQAINYTTFHYYEIYNRSATNYHDVFISEWADVDLGYFLNDYIGTDTANGFAYCYNANNFDNDGFGRHGYQDKLPVSSHVLLPTDCSADGIDNDQDALIDEPGEQFILNKVSYYNNNLSAFLPATTNPTNGAQYYQYMKSIWKDGTPFTYGGNGYNGTIAYPHVYTGNPQNNTGWTEKTANNPAGDRRFNITSGPINFPAKTKIQWGYAIVFSRDTSQPVNTISQFSSRVQRDVKNVKYYHATHLAAQCGNTKPVGIKEQQTDFINVMAYPNPGSENLTLDLNKNVGESEITIRDLTGRVVMTQHAQGVSLTINTTALSPGLYIIEVRADKSSAQIKWMKQ